MLSPDLPPQYQPFVLAYGDQNIRKSRDSWIIILTSWTSHILVTIKRWDVRWPDEENSPAHLRGSALTVDRMLEHHSRSRRVALEFAIVTYSLPEEMSLSKVRGQTVNGISRRFGHFRLIN